MANYEKQVEQEAAYPIPISLYNCYRTVRQEKRGIAIYILQIAFLMPHCPVTVVQRYRDGVCSLLFHLFFIICHPYIPLHLEEMIFYTCRIVDVRAMTQQILKNSWWRNVWFLCSVTLVLLQFSLETDSCCGNGNKLVVAWAFPRDHIGVVGTVVT